MSVMNGGEGYSIVQSDSNEMETNGDKNNDADERLNQFVPPSGARINQNIAHTHTQKCDHDKINLQPDQQNDDESRESPPVDDPNPSEHRFSSCESEGSSNGHGYDEEDEEVMEGTSESYSEYSDDLELPSLVPIEIQGWIPPVTAPYRKRERTDDSDTFNTGPTMDVPNGSGDETPAQSAPSDPFISGRGNKKHRDYGILSNFKLWHILLILASLALITVIIVMNLSSELQLLTGVQMGIVGVATDSRRLSLTANKTTGALFITSQDQHPYFWSIRYTDDLFYTGNNTLFVEYHQSRVCSIVVDESVVCCKRNRILQTVCFFRSYPENRSEASRMKMTNMIVWDAEQYQNDVRILAQHHQSYLELRWNSTRSDLIDFGLDNRRLSMALLHNGAVYALYAYEQATKNSLRKLCIWRPSDPYSKSSCMNIHIPRDPDWPLVKFWPAIGAKSLVLLHCMQKKTSKLPIGKTPTEQDMYPRHRCALTQLLLDTGVPIAKSEPFEVFEGINAELTIVGMTLTEDKDPTAFRVYKLGRTADQRWQLMYEKYTLLSADAK